MFPFPMRGWKVALGAGDTAQDIVPVPHEGLEAGTLDAH